MSDVQPKGIDVIISDQEWHIYMSIAAADIIQDHFDLPLQLVMDVGNLYDWSKISPQALAAQQAALQSYMRSVTASVSMAALNARLSDHYGAGQIPGNSYDDRSMLGLMRQMVSLLEEGKEIYLDTGALVGGTSMAMSHDFAMKAKRRRS